jgi:DNA-binding MurR/RpiR family transcriptional regulator
LWNARAEVERLFHRAPECVKLGAMSELEDEAPRDFAALRALIGARADRLPRRLRQVASYALNHPDEIAFGTAASVAASAEVQPSTLVRFSQSFGYEGYSDFQDVFRARLRDRVPSYDERLSQLRARGLGASTTSLLLDGFVEAARRSVTELHERIDAGAIERAVELLTGAQIIYLVGLRRSFPITVYLAYALGKLGVANALIDGVAGLGAEQVSSISRRDALLAISFTPYASETVALTNAAKARGARIVAITDAALSPIAPVADAWLEVVEADFEGFRSTAATMALAMTLAVAVAQRRGTAEG